jgi:alpha-glucosidase
MRSNQGSNSEWWRGAVIYQIYPRSFMDSNGDGIGDLPGITSRLEHVAGLGVDAIWVSPFFRSPMKDFGYDVSDYRDVDPIFGTLSDFDELLARAHSLGLKIIIDQVLSHTSDQHAWFTESRSSRNNPKADWYVWADPRPDGTPPTNWLSVFGGPAWQWDSRRRQYYLHSFLKEQPDLNFHCAEVQEALLGEVRFWCERGVDGFRFDACNHQFHDAQLRDNPPASTALLDEVSTVRADNPYAMQQHLYDKSQMENLAFLESLRKLLDTYGAVALGEVGDENAPPVMAQYTELGRRLHLAYSFSLLTAEHSARHLRHQVETLDHALEPTGGWGCWAVSNHDVPRVATRWSNGKADDTRRDRLWLTLLLTLRGSASIYQGEELGLPEAEVPFELLQDPYGRAFWPEFKGRDGCRTPMPGKPTSSTPDSPPAAHGCRCTAATCRWPSIASPPTLIRCSHSAARCCTGAAASRCCAPEASPFSMRPSLCCGSSGAGGTNRCRRSSTWGTSPSPSRCARRWWRCQATRTRRRPMSACRRTATGAC